MGLEDVEINQVRLASSYSALPDRRITQNPFIVKISISYGIILYFDDPEQKDDKCWLIAQRNISPAFYIILCGTYRKSDLTALISVISDEERIKLKEAILKGNLIDLYNTVLTEHNERDRKNAELLLFDNRDLILSLLEKPGSKENEWLWPKGQQLRRNENILICALREFNEETGIILSPDNIISMDPVIEEVKGLSGRKYENHFFVAITQTKYTPEIYVDESSEISNCEWKSEGEVISLFPSGRIDTIHKAKEIIADYKLSQLNIIE